MARAKFTDEQVIEALLKIKADTTVRPTHERLAAALIAATGVQIKTGSVSVRLGEMRKRYPQFAEMKDKEGLGFFEFPKGPGEGTSNGSGTKIKVEQVTDLQKKIANMMGLDLTQKQDVNAVVDNNMALVQPEAITEGQKAELGITANVPSKKGKKDKIAA